MSIEINHITKDYGNNKGIFDVCLSIHDGETFGFLGPNGAGKTTTIRHLLGFIQGDSGNCQINGMDCFAQSALIQKDLGYLPGEIALMDEMTGMEFITFMAEMKGLKDLTYAHELMEMFELDPRGKIKKMSKGMKQKVGLVCACMHDPKVLILDEPTSGLDPLMQQKFIALIKKEKEKGKTILMSSHMLEEVEKTCDRIGIIKEGHILKVEDAQNLKSSAMMKYRIVFHTEEEAKAFIGIYTQGERKDTVVTLSSVKDINALLRDVSKFSIQSFQTESASLEEIFMQFYGGENHD